MEKNWLLKSFPFLNNNSVQEADELVSFELVVRQIFILRISFGIKTALVQQYLPHYEKVFFCFAVSLFRFSE